MQPPNSNVPNWIKSSLAFIALVIPVPPIFVILHSYTQNIEQAALLTAAAEGIIFIIVSLRGVFGPVWQTTLKNAAEDFQFLVQRWVDRSIRPFYLREVVEECRSSDLRGTKLLLTSGFKLPELYVSLRIERYDVPTIKQQNKQVGDEDIWTWLAFLPDSHLAIIGDAGSGKTTLLKNVAYSLAQQKISVVPRLIRHLIPIRITLEPYIEKILDNSEISLFEISALATEQIAKKLQKQNRHAQFGNWLERQLINGRCLLLLDGLDEVGNKETRQKVVHWVKNQTVQYRENRFLITSRQEGYEENLIDGFTHLHVKPLSMEQKQSLITNWYTAFYRSNASEPLKVSEIQQRVEEKRANIWKKLRGSHVMWVFTENPLLLTMIIDYYESFQTIASSRTELYENICYLWLGNRDESRDLFKDNGINPSQYRKLIELIAWQMMINNKRAVEKSTVMTWINPLISSYAVKISAEDFLAHSVQRSGKIFTRLGQYYSFTHKTFQEYLASTHLAGTLHGDVRLLIEQIDNPFWYETIRLYFENGTQDVSPLLEAALNHATPSAAMLALAKDCETPPSRVDNQSLRNQLDVLIEESLESSEPTKRKFAAQVLLERQINSQNEWILIDNERYLSRFPVCNAIWELFVSELLSANNLANYLIPLHWTNTQFPVGTAKEPITGINAVATYVFYTWLAKKYGKQNDIEFSYQAPNIEEIKGNLPDIKNVWIFQGGLFSLYESENKSEKLEVWAMPDGDIPEELADWVVSAKQNLWYVLAVFTHKKMEDTDALETIGRDLSQMKRAVGVDSSAATDPEVPNDENSEKIFLNMALTLCKRLDGLISNQNYNLVRSLNRVAKRSIFSRIFRRTVYLPNFKIPDTDYGFDDAAEIVTQLMNLLKGEGNYTTAYESLVCAGKLRSCILKAALLAKDTHGKSVVNMYVYLADIIECMLWINIFSPHTQYPYWVERIHTGSLRNLRNLVMFKISDAQKKEPVRGRFGQESPKWIEWKNSIMVDMEVYVALVNIERQYQKTVPTIGELYLVRDLT